MRPARARKPRAWFDPTYVKDESRRSYRLAFILFWSVLLYLAFERYVISLGIVTDRSMLPTLSEGDYYFVNKYIYHLTRPKRGEVVVLRAAPYADERYVKRVIATSGEALEVRSGTVYIDGRRLVEPYALGPTAPDFGPYRLNNEMYFVMGDNRLQSEDSRHFGAVRSSEIEGKIKPGTVFPFR